MVYALNNTTYNVEIIKKNNKNIYIRVKEDLTITVTCNKRTSLEEIAVILNNNQKSLQRMIDLRVKEIQKNVNFFLFGDIYDIIIVPTMDKIEVVGNYIYVKDKKMLDSWLKEKIDMVFKEHYEYWIQHFSEQIPYYRMRSRNMKTRWGVCNKQSKTITLNTNLVKYDMRCLDYVIVHELSHLIHFNHSEHFWKLVEKNYPHYKEVRKMLK